MYQQLQMGMMPAMQPAMAANLPVPANAFLQQPTAPNISNPVFANSISQDPVISQYSQQILWAIANELTNNAVRINSALRVFAYNLYSSNGFNNHEFFGLGQLVGQRIKLGILRQEYPNIETAISVLVPETVTIVSGANIRRFDGLMQYCNANQVNDTLGAAQRLDRIQAEIQAIGNIQVQPMQGHVTGQANIGQQPIAGVGQAGAVMHGIGNNLQSANAALTTMPVPSKPVEQMTALERQAYEAEVDAVNAQAQRMSQATLQYNPNPTMQTGIMSRPSNLASQYNSNPVVVAPQESTHQAAELQAPTNCTVLHVGANAPAYTAPSAEEHQRQVKAAQEYAADQQQVGTVVHTHPEQLLRSTYSRAELITAPDMIQKSEVLKREVGGVAGYVIRINGKEHTIVQPGEYGEITWAPSALQPYHPLINLSFQKLFYLQLETGEVIAIVQSLPEGKHHVDYDKHALYGTFGTSQPLVPDSGKPLQKPSFAEVKVPNMKLLTANLSEYFALEQALNISHMDATGRFANATEEGTLAAIYETRVYTPVVFDDPQIASKVFEALVSLGASPNFAVAAAAIGDIENPLVRKIVNQYVTRRVNDVLKFEMSVANNVIDNFLTDHAELLQVVATNYAGAIAETISSHQSRIVRTAMTVVRHDKLDNAYEYFAANPEEAASSMARTLFLSRGATITVCAFNDADIAPFFAEEACAVLETTHPQLREIIVRSMQTKHLSSKLTTAHYLVTADGYRYQVANSMTAPGTFLIRRV